MSTLKQQILNDLELLPETMQAETLDFVQFLKTKLNRTQEPVPTPPNGATIAQILERLAERNTLSGITDPSAWQREIRKDRVLPEKDA